MLVTDFEKKIGRPLKRNITVLGLDTASKSGFCVLKLTKKKLTYKLGTFKVDTKDTNFRYNGIIDFFQELIKPEYKVVIEDTFFRFNPRMYCMISRIGAIAYTLAHLKGCEVDYLYCTSARKSLGLKGNGKKADVQADFKRMIGIEIEDNDACDAMILAISGALAKLI